MTRRTLLWSALLALPLAVTGGLVFANSQARSYTCPITGEQLPCAKCCPLNQKQQAKEQTDSCPLTGEELPCPNCCPLNRNSNETLCGLR